MSGPINGISITLLDAVAATGASKEISPGVSNFSICHTITGTATVTPQVSNDGVNWVAVSGMPAVTASGASITNGAFKYVRVNVTAYTSGTVTSTIFY